jgi:O-antigen ligase
MAYAGCFTLALVAGRDPERAGATLRLLTALAVGYAIYGLMMQSTGLRMVLWYDKWAYQDFVTSTFVNKKSYATYAALGLQCCLAALWRQLKHKPKPQPNRRAMVGAWIEQVSRRALFTALTIIILLGTLIMTGSRGGIVAGLGGSLALCMALAVNRRWGWKIWLGVLVPTLVVVLAVGIVSADIVLDRLSAAQVESDSVLRTTAYDVALKAIADRPWQGYGLGSFEAVFRAYRDVTVTEWFEHAHNDYLEAALELGIPAASALGLTIILVLSCCLQGVWQRRRHEAFPALALGASVTVGLHSLVDFGMQIPAVAATYAVILGLGVAQSWGTATRRPRL